MSSTVIVYSLFVIGPGSRPRTEIVDWGGTVLVGFYVDHNGGAGAQRLPVAVLELGRLAHRHAVRPERARKAGPVVIRNAGQLHRQRAMLPGAQPDIAERAIVHD